MNNFSIMQGEGSSSRREIDELLFEKLSNALSEKQKRNKILH